MFAMLRRQASVVESRLPRIHKNIGGSHSCGSESGVKCRQKPSARFARSIRGEVKRNTSPPAGGEMFLAIQPMCRVRARDFPGSGDSSRWRDDVLRFLTQTSSAVVRCQPWFYLRLEAYSFFWLSEGAYGLSRDSRCLKHTLRLTRLRILILEPERFKNRRTPPEMHPRGGGVLDSRSSCLLFQMFGVEAHSFLPDE
jgi:hypothetical protein